MTHAMNILNEIAQVVAQNKTYLDELDKASGDGDHGSNLAEGFSRCLERVASLQDAPAAVLLKKVGVALFSTAPGSGGHLLATAVMRAGDALIESGKDCIDTSTACDMLCAACKGVAAKGGAVTGQKTMLDAMYPALYALCAAKAQALPFQKAMTDALQAAWGGVAFTKTIPASIGTAAYLGEQTVGYQDPGATSFALILSVLCDHAADTSAADLAYN